MLWRELDALLLHQDALEISLKMALSMPLSDILAYPKVGKAYFTLLESLCHNHLSFIASCEVSIFTFIANSLEAGLRSLDVTVSSMCATALDNLAGFYFQAIKGDETPSRAAQVIPPPPDLHPVPKSRHPYLTPASHTCTTLAACQC